MDFQSGKSYNPPASVQFASLVDLEDKYLPFIPDVMTFHSWLNGAVLMERWFCSPPHIAKDYAADDNETIKMESWLLTFKRAREKYDELIARLTNQATRAKLSDRIAAATAIMGKANSQGESRIGENLSQAQWESCYVNSIPCKSSIFGDIDDLFCALGTFQFRLTVRGRCKPVPLGITTHRMDIWLDSYGVYAFDSFDFNDDEGKPTQELGHWNIRERSVSKASGGLYTIHVTNQSFQRFRKKHNCGGDFRVFSDIYWTKLDRELYIAI